jgi:hypothetical protein
MRLIIDDSPALAANNPDLKLYKNVKQLLLASELECAPSLHLVQAWLLMATFEMGHGLDAGAFLSIGTCARLAMLLGMDDNRDLRNQSSTDWIEVEEKRRVWWGIVIVERCVSTICI